VVVIFSRLPSSENPDGIAFNYDVKTASEENSYTYKLLKEATEKKKSGDLGTAIELLRKAYKEIIKSSTTYSVNTFLRLPLYLQQAKKNDEAWREFNNLLVKGYPNQMNDPVSIPMDHSIIYDKMRLFLHREGKNELAIRFGVFSYLSRAIGLYKQARNERNDHFWEEDLKEHTSQKSIESVTERLLKKAKKENLAEKVNSIIEEELRHLPNIDFRELAKRIDSVVSG